MFDALRRMFAVRQEMRAERQALQLGHAEARGGGAEGRVTAENLDLVMDFVLAQATWLRGSQRRAIRAAVSRQSLVPAEKVLLLKILCCIPYAERYQDAHGKTVTYIVSNIWGVFQSSHGSWQLHQSRAELLGLRKQDFVKMMQSDDEGALLVAEYVLRHIGLHKGPEAIFAEYNMNVNAAVIFTLQVLLNRVRAYLAEEERSYAADADALEREERLHEYDLHMLKDGALKEALSCLKPVSVVETHLLQEWPVIREDGWWGGDTQRAWVALCTYANVSYGHTDAALRELAQHMHLEIPPHAERRTVGFFFRHVRNARFRKALNAFANHVDVRTYTQVAMQAYQYLPA